MAVLMGGEALDMKRARRRVRQDLALDRYRCRAPYFLYDRLGVGGALPLIAFCAGLAVARCARSLARRTSRSRRRPVRRSASCAPRDCALGAACRSRRRAARCCPPTAAPRTAIVIAAAPRAARLEHLPLSPAGAPRRRQRGRSRLRRARADRRRSRGGDDRRGRRSHARLVDHWTSIDEVIYSLQAHLFAQGDYRWHLETGFSGSSRCRSWCRPPAGPYSQYTPGYPAILAAFLTLGALSVSGAVLGAVAVASTYMLGRRCASPFVGVVAAACSRRTSSSWDSRRAISPMSRRWRRSPPRRGCF